MAVLYIVFSATGYRTGGFIRAVTRGEYNHVSVAFDPKLDEIYSFGRLKLQTPFCGGFVREGAERFCRNEGVANIAVCAVEIADDRMESARERLSDMCADSDRYVYNMISAACVPIKRRVRIRDSYTCIEFAVSMLRTAGVPLADKYYSIEELYRILQHCEIYRGAYPASATVADASYDDAIPVRRRVTSTTRQLGRLAYRCIRH